MSDAPPWTMTPDDGPFLPLDPVEQVHALSPPVPVLVGAAVVLLVSTALVPAGGYADVAHGVGWLLASVGGVGLLAWFTSEDLRRRANSQYSPMPLTGRVRTGLAVSALVLCGIHAWTLGWSIAAR